MSDKTITSNFIDFGENLFRRKAKEFANLIEPKVNQMYARLKELGHVYDLNKNRMENIEDTMFSDDHNIYAAILPEDALKRGRGMVVHYGEQEYVVFLVDKPYEDEHYNDIPKGFMMYQRFLPLNKSVIEDSWGLTDVVKVATKADLITDTYTDQTEHSQVIKGDYDHVVCHRPTVERLIEDFNGARCGNYEVALSNNTHWGCSADMGRTKNAAQALTLTCLRLEIEGVDF